MHPKKEPGTFFRVYIHELGEGFFDPVEPASFPMQIQRFRNQAWAERVGLGGLTDEQWKRHFAFFDPLPGNLKRPLALRYHGHQFQSYNPDLGDGRGFLFAQLRDSRDQRILDLGTKGSGQTPYSRSGDGRLTLKGAVREILATEMLEALGVNTSKTFSVFETGEALQRHDEPSPTRAGVLVRLNHSHIRFGTFQRQAYEESPERLQILVDYCIRNYYPSLHKVPEGARASALLREVTLKSADLAAQWMMAGFVHGVLNTDNMNITGESFDYGPYRFLPTYDPEFTAAYFDHTGLYAYGKQPETVLWNLEQLASTLTLIVPERQPLIEALQEFAPRFNAGMVKGITQRLGVVPRSEEKDEELFVAAFNGLAFSKVGFEQFFYDWYGGEASCERALQSAQGDIYRSEHFAAFIPKILDYETDPAVKARLQDPYFQKPKPQTLLIDEIESIWDAIAKRDDWSLLETKVTEIRKRGKLYGNRDI